MGSIEKFIKRVAVQTAVYWANPVKKGAGGYTFDEAVQIKVRWDDLSEVLTDDDGRELVSRAKLLVTSDLTKGGYLYLGFLIDFDSDVDLTKPKDITGAYQIRKISKIPMIKKTNDFVRTVWIGGTNA